MSEGNKRFCTNCGSEVSEGAKFCMNCGSKVETPVGETVSQETSVAEVSENEAQVQEAWEKTPMAEASGNEAQAQEEWEKTPMVEASGNEVQAQQAWEEAPVMAVPEAGVDVHKEIDIHYEDEAADVEAFPQPERYTGETVVKDETNGNLGFSIASMICGIISIICCCLYTFSIILAIVAIVLGVIALRGKYEGKGMAIAGIVTGGIGLLIWIIILAVGGLTFFEINSLLDY